MRRAVPLLLAAAVAAGATLLGPAVPPSAGWSRTADPASPGAATSSPPGPGSGPAGPVLPPTAVEGSTAPVPTAAGVRSAVGALLADPVLGGSVAATVLDPATGQVLFDRDAQQARVPASTVKILTALAALTTLGPTDRLRTRVVAGAGSGEVVLVGAGDATLSSADPEPRDPTAPASLVTLAERTADALAQRGRQQVRLGYDAALFTGPQLGPGWPTSFPALGVAAPVAALMVDGGRAAPGGVSRVADPALAAAQRFADLLTARGITVTDVAPAGAAAAAPVLAEVRSPTVADLVERMLTESDNDLAEALAHLAGVADGSGGSFAGGAAATTAALAGLGLPTAGLALADGSGLSRDNAVPAILLGQALGLVARQQDPAGWPIGPGLPVAGVTGTLADRFLTSTTAAGAGVVRAKTGTLTGVVGLAGLVRDVDGRVLAFAFLADQVGSLLSAREVFDRAATRLAGCGCR